MFNCWCSEAEGIEKFIISNGDSVVLTHNLEHGMEAELKGVLEYDNETKCLYIKNTIQDDLNPINVPIWPKGTTAYTENKCTLLRLKKITLEYYLHHTQKYPIDRLFLKGLLYKVLPKINKLSLYSSDPSQIQF